MIHFLSLITHVFDLTNFFKLQKPENACCYDFGILNFNER